MSRRRRRRAWRTAFEIAFIVGLVVAGIWALAVVLSSMRLRGVV